MYIKESLLRALKAQQKGNPKLLKLFNRQLPYLLRRVTPFNRRKILKGIMKTKNQFKQKNLVTMDNETSQKFATLFFQELNLRKNRNKPTTFADRFACELKEGCLCEKLERAECPYYH